MLDEKDMTFRLLPFFTLKVFFIFSFISCTFLGIQLDEDSFQSEEEEYYAETTFEREEGIETESTNDEIGSDSDVLEGIFSDSVLNEGISTDEDSVSGVLTNNEDSQENIDDSSSKKKKWIPLKKIPTKPWKQSGKWVNTVYIVRPADNLSQISMMLFSENKIEELKDFNPFLKRRDPKVGDKIYYSSPNRPSDKNNFYHYYEDNNKIAQTYDLSTGNNIRTVSERLLGHKNSWKEIWATNPQIESKGAISDPVTIQYWIADTAPINTPPIEEEPPMMPQEEEATEEVAMAIEEPDDIPIPDDEPVIIEDTSVAMDELPIEKPQMDPVQEDSMKTKSSWNNDKIKIISAGVILVIVALLLAKIIRDRKNRSDFDFSQTHIDIDNLEE